MKYLLLLLPLIVSCGDSKKSKTLLHDSNVQEDFINPFETVNNEEDKLVTDTPVSVTPEVINVNVVDTVPQITVYDSYVEVNIIEPQYSVVAPIIEPSEPEVITVSEPVPTLEPIVTETPLVEVQEQVQEVVVEPVSTIPVSGNSEETNIPNPVVVIPEIQNMVIIQLDDWVTESDEYWLCHFNGTTHTYTIDPSRNGQGFGPHKNTGAITDYFIYLNIYDHLDMVQLESNYADFSVWFWGLELVTVSELFDVNALVQFTATMDESTPVLCGKYNLS